MAKRAGIIVAIFVSLWIFGAVMSQGGSPLTALTAIFLIVILPTSIVLAIRWCLGFKDRKPPWNGPRTPLEK